MAYALTFEGYDYVYGGTTPAGFDCSGFVQYVYRHFGFNITRTATSQYYNDGEHVSRSELMPGDLVFFDHACRHLHRRRTFHPRGQSAQGRHHQLPERELLQRPLLRREPHHF